jgi:CheY-like chemotaxis protein
MGKKILLADDSITIQKVIELTFSDEDFDVVTVGNGRLALERLAEVRPDIVLCDIIMPEKDGYEVCEQIKKSASFSHVPVLLLTGAFEPFDQERAARAGYDGSLAKPFEPETLIAKVRDLLARAPQRAAPSTPPVVPFARPTAVVPPQAVPPPPPPPPPVPLRAVAPPSPPRPAEAFIPEEPFERAVPSAVAAAPPLAPMSEEESATLLAAPAEEPEAESASTVMFKASELPWNATSTPVTAPVSPMAAPPPPPPPPARVEPAFVPESESVFEPEALDAAEVVEEATVFEEVVEEDLEFEAPRVIGGDEAGSADSGATLMFSGTGTLPPSAAPQESSATTASFGVVEETTFSEADFEAVTPSEPEPEPEPEVATAPPARAPVYSPPPRAPEPPRAQTPPSIPAARPPEPRHSPTPPSMAAARPAPPPPSPPAPPPAPPPRPEPKPAPSFADLAPHVPEREAVPASEAAAVSVPMDMVEKIAQRVVAQISEKAVREIAWEVIPDLAEALIKQEIERLKAELQKL